MILLAEEETRSIASICHYYTPFSFSDMATIRGPGFSEPRERLEWCAVLVRVWRNWGIPTISTGLGYWSELKRCVVKPFWYVRREEELHTNGHEDGLVDMGVNKGRILMLC